MIVIKGIKDRHKVHNIIKDVEVIYDICIKIFLLNKK